MSPLGRPKCECRSATRARYASGPMRACHPRLAAAAQRGADRDHGRHPHQHADGPASSTRSTSVSEGQKRTITAGSDAQQNASYGLFLIGQDLMGAGQVISASTTALERLRDAAAHPGGDRGGRDGQRSGFDHRALWRVELAVHTGAALELARRSVGRRRRERYVVAGPLCVQPERRRSSRSRARTARCRRSMRAASRSRAHRHRDDQSHADRDARQQHDGDLRRRRGISSSTWARRRPRRAGAVRPDALHRSTPAANTLRTQSLLPTVQPVTTAVVSNVVNLKAQFGLDTDN